MTHDHGLSSLQLVHTETPNFSAKLDQVVLAYFFRNVLFASEVNSDEIEAFPNLFSEFSA
tara:strand:- start:583 stop:762 length:180 start_codon:yes stop_codon:yes gene_type:complete